MSYSTRRTKGDYRWVPPVQGKYRLYQGDKIVYVGESNNLPRRLQQHELYKKHWGTYDYCPTPGCKTVTRRNMEERSIKINHPTRNIKHRSK